MSVVGVGLILTEPSDPEFFSYSKERLNVCLSNLDFAIVHEVNNVEQVREGNVPQNYDGVGARIAPQEPAKKGGAC